MKFFQIFLNKTISLLYIFITLTLIFVNGFSNEPSELHQVYDNNTKRCDLDCNILINHAETLGDVRVIVDLNVPELSRLQLNSSLNNDDIDIRELERKRLVAQAQEQLLKRISQYHLIYQYKTVASIVLKANANTLQMMINDPNVLRLSLDKPTYTSLVESNPLIGTDQAWEKGFTGKNYTIAILDTGIDKTHPFLQGKVIDEACFSSTDSGKDPIYGPWETKSLCPNSQLNTNDTPGQPCEDLVGCDHGTHVAGIIAGTGNEFSGVARDADVISIQVFAQGERGICGSNPSPCLVSLMSDQIAALDAIYDDLRNKHTIVAINMSLGGGYYKTICDDDMPNAYKQVMELLKNKSISTIVASGNNGYIDGIAAPACISSTVSVGSTTKENNVSSFSNSVDFLTMLAPGGLGAGNQLDIYSSLPNGFFGYKAGTSMAAPHVAGAFAIVQQQSPTAKTSQILSLLTSHGKPIKDIRNTLTKPRLRLDNMPWLTNTVADEIHNLGMDHKKNIYAGYVGDDGSFIIKYSSSGKEEWRIDFDTYIEDMTFDEDGNTYAVMYMSDWDYDDRIVKYNSNGELVWETGFDDYTTTDIIVDDNGSVYVLGKNDEERKMGVLKFDRDGKREWEGIDTESSHFLWDSNQRDLMVVDKNHNVYAAVKKDCTGNCPYTSYETRIIKFNTSGKYEWAKTVHIEDSTENYEWLENLPSYIAIDDEANIYVAGWVGNWKQAKFKSHPVILKLNSE